MARGLTYNMSGQDISIQSDMLRKLDSFEESVNLLQKMSKQIQTTTEDFAEKGYEYIYLSLTNKICRNCPAFRECFGAEREETLDEIGMIFEQIDQKHCVDASMAPEAFRKHCIYFNAFIEEMSWLYKLAYQNYYWEKRLNRLRQTMQGQLAAQSHFLGSLRHNLESGYRISGRRKLRFMMKLLPKGVMLLDGMEYQEKDEPFECVLVVQSMPGAKKAECLLPAVSSLYRKNMCLNQENCILQHSPQRISFVADTGFYVFFGKVSCNKKGELLNGDSFSFINDSRKKAAMILSDGMGSGKKAFEQSKKLIEVLEQMIQSGVSEEFAMEILHQALLFQGKEGFSTLDLAMISLQTGVLKMIKAGGCATFIKRKDHVERVKPEGLPPGSYMGQKFDLQRKKLYDGDMIIMVSDGVLAFEQMPELPFQMEQMIQEIHTNNAQKFAKKLMEAVPICEDFDDDRTILVASIWEKGKKHVGQD